MSDDEALPSTGELLSEWRARERETATAKWAVRIADAAMAAASGAEEAAAASDEAAKAATEAANASRTAAERAKMAAKMATESAQEAVVTAEGDYARAIQAMDTAQAAEGKARDAFQSVRDEAAQD